MARESVRPTNTSMPGAPQTIINLNFNNVADAFDRVKMLCERYSTTKAKVKRFFTLMKNYFQEEDLKDTETQATPQTNNAATQTDDDNPDTVQKVLDLVKHLDADNRVFILEAMWLNIPEEERVSTIYKLYSDITLEFGIEGQIRFLSLLGETFSEHLLNIYKEHRYKNGTTMEDLANIKNQDYYEIFDERLKALIEGCCKKKFAGTNNLNDICEVLEGLVKARHRHYVSEHGIRQHLLGYIDSKKSGTVLQVFNKVGAKGSKRLLEDVIKNTELAVSFSPPRNVSCFYSFDNIQTLFRSHRLEGKNADKVLAIVVTSVLATLPDGVSESNIQYLSEHSPASWYTSLQKHPTKEIFVEKLDEKILMEIMNISEEDETLIDEYFKKAVENELDIVMKEIDMDTGKDLVDLKVTEKYRKKIRLCTDNHINVLKKNQKFCDRPGCKQRLKDENEIQEPTVRLPTNENKLTNDELRCQHYLNVPQVVPEFQPQERPVGAYQVNPNTSERIQVVLDNILENSDLKDSYCVKLKITDGKIEKIVSPDTEERKFVVVTSDGLPYKEMIKILQNNYVCGECGVNLTHPSEITKHLKETHHDEYFQRYGSLLPNIGMFHFTQTGIRAVTKTVWDIELEELAKSIGLESQKALFSFKNVTNFRQSFDLLRQARSANIREMLYPYIQHCLTENLEIDAEGFLTWKEEHSRSENYNLIFEIEKYFVTSLLMMLSSLRANNESVLQTSKRMFSPLFHVMNNRNYSVMDIQTEYQDRLMEKKAPALSEYLSTRKCTNKTGRTHSAEPLDERHEEFNKRGLNIQNVRSLEDFVQNFKICDAYADMKKACLGDYGLGTGNSDTCGKPPDYEENILKMRVRLRGQKYLSEPEKNQRLANLNGDPLNKDLNRLVSLSRAARKNNVMKVIRHQAFDNFENYKLNILENNEDKLSYNLESHIKILIACEADIEKKAFLYEYWQDHRDKAEFDEQMFIDSILSGNISI